MNRKAISFKISNPEGWETRQANSAAAESREVAMVAMLSQPAMRRFTIDVSDELHKRIKAQCALRGVKMANVLREILEREFPKT
jgi:predicted DNA binding CopG/RHH family protein